MVESPEREGAAPCGSAIDENEKFLFVVLDCAYADAVPGFFFEHIADAFAFSLDAVGSYAIFLDEGVFH